MPETDGAILTDRDEELARECRTALENEQTPFDPFPSNIFVGDYGQGVIQRFIARARREGELAMRERLLRTFENDRGDGDGLVWAEWEIQGKIRALEPETPGEKAWLERIQRHGVTSAETFRETITSASAIVEMKDKRIAELQAEVTRMKSDMNYLRDVNGALMESEEISIKRAERLDALVRELEAKGQFARRTRNWNDWDLALVKVETARKKGDTFLCSLCKCIF